MRYLNARHDIHTIASMQRMIAGQNNRDAFMLGVFARENGDHIGNHRLLCDLVNQTCYGGALVGDRRYWGRKAIVETRARVLQFLFEEVGIAKVCARVYARNVPSIFNYQALGFAVEGVLKSHVNFGEGRCDVIEFALLREAWQAGRAVEGETT
jgi:RimJ/RimL family protein N-acetyltransferase